MEEWKAIPGYEGRYEASSHGRIRNKRGRVLAPIVHHSNYHVIHLYDGSGMRGRRNISIHSLIARTFLPDPGAPIGMGAGKGFVEVNHKDGNKGNNAVENLEYCSRSANVKHAFATGLRPSHRGEGSPNAKLTEDDVRSIRAEAAIGVARQKLAARYGVSVVQIRNIIHRKSWSHI